MSEIVVDNHYVNKAIILNYFRDNIKGKLLKEQSVTVIFDWIGTTPINTENPDQFKKYGKAVITHETTYQDNFDCFYELILSSLKSVHENLHGLILMSNITIDVHDTSDMYIVNMTFKKVNNCIIN